MARRNCSRDLKTVTQQSGLFLDQFSKESDRAVSILAVCLLDDMLEKIIQASYVRDPKVKTLFKNDHILQSFHSKVNIAYFSGLIPKVFYHDLQLIGEIRNKFAHAVVADLKFSHPMIAARIDKFELGCFQIPELSVLRRRFSFVVAQIVGVLRIIEQLVYLDKSRPLINLYTSNEELVKRTLLPENKVRAFLQEHQ